MFNTFPVEAVLSAIDKGFSATMKQAMGIAGKRDKKTSNFMA